MLSKITAIPVICAIWFFNALFRLLPLSFCWRLGETLGSVVHMLMPARRRVVRKNLRIVAKKHPELEVNEDLVRQVFRRSIANLTCSIKTYGMSPAQLQEVVEISYHPQFMEDVKQKKGTVTCLAHMGNWEILSKIVVTALPEGTDFGAVYRPLDNKTANKYVADQREKYGCKMFAKGVPITTLSQYIKKGGNLGILADQRAGRHRKYERPFFGAGSARSKLPAILHKRTQCPMYMAAVFSDTPGRWKIDIVPVEIQSDEVEEIVDSITAMYEKVFLDHLLDVFWLHTYWRERRQRGKSKNAS